MRADPVKITQPPSLSVLRDAMAALRRVILTSLRMPGTRFLTAPLFHAGMMTTTNDQGKSRTVFHGPNLGETGVLRVGIG